MQRNLQYLKMVFVLCIAKCKALRRPFNLKKNSTIAMKLRIVACFLGVIVPLVLVPLVIISSLLWTVWGDVPKVDLVLDSDPFYDVRESHRWSSVPDRQTAKYEEKDGGCLFNDYLFIAEPCHIIRNRSRVET